MRVWVFLIFLILIETVSAEIIISSLDDVYNVGDEINLSFSIQKQKNSADYVECYLDCGDRFLVHKRYYVLEKDKKKSFEINFPSKEAGKCSVDVSFDGEKEESSDFEISNKVDVEFSLNNKLFFPEETIIINGTAVKRNGEYLDGFVDVSVSGLENQTIEVEDGKFSLSFKIKKEALPGKYEVRVDAFEKNSEEKIINSGESVGSIEVKSKPSNISIAAVESIKPPFDFSAKISLLDQAQNQIKDENISVKLFDPEGKLIVPDTVIGSGGVFDYSFASNSLRGVWKLHAYYGNIFSLKIIYVEDNEQIEVEVVEKDGGSYLEIVNVGNVGYVGNLYASISNSSFNDSLSINLSLDVGEKVLEPLDYDGVFDITAGNKTISGVKITAAAISPVLKITATSYLIFVIIVIILIAIYLLIKKRKKLRPFKKEKEEKTAFMIFLKFDKYVDIEEAVEKEGFSLSRISDNVCYILFYDHTTKAPELSAYNLAKRIRNKFLSQMNGVSIVINSGKFYDKERFLKDFSLTSRKMLEHADGGILISEDILDKLKLKARKVLTFKSKEKTFRMYKL